jgi:DNA-binding transcriptional LysR family regulator
VRLSLNVGQTTVSARIKLLEQLLGRPLFVRNKSGASLTAAGEQFLRYAPSFVQLWQRARLQVAVPPGYRGALTIGSEVSLWEPLLLEWVSWMRGSLRDVALRVHVDVPQDLINLVASGVVDAAIMYAPQHRPGLKIDRLMEEKLVLVTSSRNGKPSSKGDNVHVDWGSDFSLHEGMNLSESTPGLSVNLGPLGLSYVLSRGGSGYFRMQAVQPHLKSGRLFLVNGAPQYSYPIYVVYSENAEDSVMGPALAGLRSIAAGQPPRAPRRLRRQSPVT